VFQCLLPLSAKEHTINEKETSTTANTICVKYVNVLETVKYKEKGKEVNQNFALLGNSAASTCDTEDNLFRWYNRL
jgi:hypothetical protein